MFWMCNKHWVLRLQEKLSAKSYGLRSRMRYLILPPVRFDCKIACSHWLLKMRKLEKLTRFCQICFTARGTGGVEEMGNCEERKKQRPGGSKSLLVHSLEVRKDTKMTFFFFPAAIWSTVEFAIWEGAALPSVAVTAAVSQGCRWDQGSVVPGQRTCPWGWRMQSTDGGNARSQMEIGGSIPVLWKFSHICPKCMYDQSIHHRDGWKVKLGTTLWGTASPQEHCSPPHLPGGGFSELFFNNFQ